MNKKAIPTRTSEALRESSIKDFLVGVFITVAFTFILIWFDIDLSTAFFETSRQNQHLQLEKVVLGIVLFGAFAIIFAFRRFSDVKRLNHQITSLAYFDSVTDLPNRTFALERLGQLLAHSKRHNKNIAVLFIDFDRFKMVNDTYGHANGDLLIKSVGQRISSALREEDTLARLGGDEFLIILNLDKSINELNKLLIRLTEVQGMPHQIDNWEAYISFSIGVAIYPKDGLTADELLMAADTAMYKAKEKGEGLFHFYSDAIGRELADRYLMEVGLKKAMLEQELKIVFQPILDVKTRKTTSYEVLLRWDFNGQAISPELVIEIAEELQFINELGNWVLIKAIQEAKQNLPKNSKIAVNISPTQFLQSNFVQNVLSSLKKESFAPACLILEVTESAVQQDYEEARANIIALRSHGIKIAIDDFGTGHSSLDRISELEVDTLKIDKSFVAKMMGNHNNYKVINAIVALAKQLDISITAEGVETLEQMNLLFQFECDHLQGFYIGRPVPSTMIAH